MVTPHAKSRPPTVRMRSLFLPFSLLAPDAAWEHDGTRRRPTLTVADVQLRLLCMQFPQLCLCSTLGSNQVPVEQTVDEGTQ
jgi:hypothetical protein